MGFSADAQRGLKVAQSERSATLPDVSTGPETPPEDLPAWRLGAWVLSLTDLSPESRRAYETGVRSFVEWASRGPVDEPSAITRLVLRRYLAYLSTRHYARQTVAQRASSLRRYFGWLVRQGVVATDPTTFVSARGGSGKLPRALSRGDVEVILDDPPALGGAACPTT